MSRGEVVLFTGAGFSFGANDRHGRPIPGVTDLTREIAGLVWPDDEYDPGLSLPDTYAAAYREAQGKLKALLEDRLTVDPASTTDAHRTWLSMPWRRAYTLNIDDLETAAAREHELPRQIHPHSPLRGKLPLEIGDALLYVHLNGALADVPEVTFTEPQYGRRHTDTNALYEQLAADLLAYPVVFVGTELRESLFWRYVELRDEKGDRGVKEMRPRSYLVTPELPKDRARLLDAYNIRWVEATADEFASEVLEQLGGAVTRGLQVRRARGVGRTGEVELLSVTELASLPAPPRSDYLWGAEPTWDDIRSGRAVERAFEEDIELPNHGCVLVTGTAGAGTSTTLMRLALARAAEGTDVRWVDANHAFSARELSRYLRKYEEPLTVVIDDADTFGRTLSELVADVIKECPGVLLLIGMHATRVDAVLPGWDPGGQGATEIDVPNLADDDIDRLIGVLSRENKLGALKPKPPAERVKVFQDECGRQLLVAMYEATSGRKFEEKIGEEFQELPAEQQLIYAIVAIANQQRAYLTRDEILMACDDTSNTALYALDRLTARGVLTERHAAYEVRHRRIAEVIVTGLRGSGRMLSPYRGLTRAIALRYNREEWRARETRLLTRLLSHAYIGSAFAISDARVIYDDIEELCKDDYHYWLQRGALEVQYGDLFLARPYLQSARDGGERDRRVHTEWAYFLIKEAWKFPSRPGAAEQVAEGEEILLRQIEESGAADDYAWHVYGSQMLGWLRAARLGADERRAKLEEVKKQLEEGVRLHPTGKRLELLRRDVEAEWLRTAIPSDN